MPEHLRALIVILILAGGVFILARRPAIEIAGQAAFARRRNVWFALTLTAFLAHDFWIYMAAASLILLAAAQREQNPLGLFFVALFVIPPAGDAVPGLGVANYLFMLDQARLLSLMVLLPAFLVLRSREASITFGRLGPDKLLIAYLFLSVVLQLRDTTATDTTRQLFLIFLDVFLPYYVASRSLGEMASFRDALLAFSLAVLVMAAIGIFEAAKHWLLYSALIPTLGVEWGWSSYVSRARMLRASASAGHPITLGYVITVGIGAFLFLKDQVKSRLHRWLAGLLLLGGLISSLSRGPWVGAGALLVTYAAVGAFAARRLFAFLLAVFAIFVLLLVLPGGDRILDFLPFIGSIDRFNVEYRQRLLENAVVVIMRNPWFGSANYLEAPEMEELRQGQDIIDIVNVYLGVGLQHGLIGLALFVGFFLSVLAGIYKAMRSQSDQHNDVYRLGQTLLGTLVAVLFIIFTVSNIALVSTVYWSVAGAGVAYCEMVRRRHAVMAESIASSPEGHLSK